MIVGPISSRCLVYHYRYDNRNLYTNISPNREQIQKPETLIKKSKADAKSAEQVAAERKARKAVSNLYSI